MDENKKRALSAALTQIERQFGKGSVMKLGSKQSMEVVTISTGSLGLDIALGVGGLPRGRVVEIYGPESSGKTTLTLQVVAEMQKLGGTAAFIDAEHALRRGATRIGIVAATAAGFGDRVVIGLEVDDAAPLHVQRVVAGGDLPAHGPKLVEIAVILRRGDQLDVARLQRDRAVGELDAVAAIVVALTDFSTLI